MIDFRTATFCYPNCATPEQYFDKIIHDPSFPLEFKITTLVIAFVIAPVAFWFVGKEVGWIGDKVPKELRQQ